MRIMKKSLLILTCNIMLVSVWAQGYHVRMGFIGNSITHGVMLANPAQDAYPIQLGEMLKDVYGDTVIVRNFGLTTTTMLKNGDVSYWDAPNFVEYLAWAPEICFIMLGTNDTKPQNWNNYGDEFVADYLAMIDTIKLRNPSTKFILAYPPPAFEIEWGINDSIIINGVIPGIDSVLSQVDAVLVDYYHPLLDSVQYFPDNIHPDVAGNTVMAEMLLEKIIESDIIHQADTGLTFITGFETSNSPLVQNDTAILSWTTLNADSVFLDGERMAVEGSLKVSPPETKIYTLLAMGDKSNDTIELTQEVYVPELTRLQIDPASVTRYPGDTVFFQTYYRDQFNRYIRGTHYAVSWNLYGSGILFEESDSSVFYVAESPDTSYLVVSYNEIYDSARIITRASTDLKVLRFTNDFRIYPNPAGEFISIRPVDHNKAFTVRVYDMKGRLRLQKEILPDSDNLIHRIKTDTLNNGNYILNIEYTGGLYTEKILILRD